MRNYFELADTSKNKKVSVSEVTAFLDSINLRLKKDQLRTMIRVINCSSFYFSQYVSFDFTFFLFSKMKTNLAIRSKQRRRAK
jgi:hypothetical protein